MEIIRSSLGIGTTDELADDINLHEIHFSCHGKAPVLFLCKVYVRHGGCKENK
jgi:hypothetical protein